MARPKPMAGLRLLRLILVIWTALACDSSGVVPDLAPLRFSRFSHFLLECGLEGARQRICSLLRDLLRHLIVTCSHALLILVPVLW
ncbi:hypothetical protein B0T26DRAFT_370402 [Lasiosphaeria miniovina]|uniref:Secreted protein n=1 Tax=Lasiosphaeria miniovina TaxID=1954250 RepID=A0AA40DSD6_9PEZI|nr:uncharacterized protein B0T26DRAFT_370402 [Lasiosphaeria miniovina]KAK0713750.1 hypothetical protein B0T26DRAFT_370402 [Lasiosphaeria miniovina]